MQIGWILISKGFQNHLHGRIQGICEDEGSAGKSVGFLGQGGSVGSLGHYGSVSFLVQGGSVWFHCGVGLWGLRESGGSQGFPMFRFSTDVASGLLFSLRHESNVV